MAGATVALLVAIASSCTISPSTSSDSSIGFTATSPSSGPTSTEPFVDELMKECPVSALRAIDALVTVEAESDTLAPVEPAIGGSAVASVRVTQVHWRSPLVDVEEGDVFEGLVYVLDATVEQWGFDDEWLAGESSLVTGLAKNQIREVDVPWELPSVLVDDDGSLRFPVSCFTARFQELARRVNRPADLSLYVDLLNGVAPVLGAAHAIDDELPGM